MKARETLLEVKQLVIVGAGMGVFVKQNKRIEKENLICTYLVGPYYAGPYYAGPYSAKSKRWPINGAKSNFRSTAI